MKRPTSTKQWSWATKNLNRSVIISNAINVNCLQSILTMTPSVKMKFVRVISNKLWKCKHVRKNIMNRMLMNNVIHVIMHSGIRICMLSIMVTVSCVTKEHNQVIIGASSKKVRIFWPTTISQILQNESQ
jgi:hypothetical protein